MLGYYLNPTHHAEVSQYIQVFWLFLFLYNSQLSELGGFRSG